MLAQIMSGRMDFSQLIIQVIALLIVIFITMPLHEWAHGFVAYKLGDNTAKMSGRLKFNPMAHIDPFGTLCIILFGIGWAKPVPINPRNFKNPKVGMAITAFAGPLSNLIAGFVGTVIMQSLYLLLTTEVALNFNYANIIMNTITFFNYFVLINIGLAVFNLLPIPPLDGSKILYAFLPNNLVYKISMYERQISFVLILLLLVGPFSKFINTASGFVYSGMFQLVAMIFGIT